MDKIKVVQLARIPCANSGYELSKLINEYSDKYECRYILGTPYQKNNALVPYRDFPIDLNWEKDKKECLQIIKEADIIHVHHDWYFEEIESLLKGKKVIVTLYNLYNSIQYADNDFNRKYLGRMKKYASVITVADQPLQKKMFSDITSISVPLVKNLFNEDIRKQNLVPHIVFAPTNHETTGIGKKMYHPVINILKRLQSEYKFTYDLIEGVPYLENLDRKRKADIIIDDVDPDYEKFHNTSLEAACFGAISLTNYSDALYPFIKTNIHGLEKTLEDLICSPRWLQQEKEYVKRWRESNYTPQILLKIYEELYSASKPTESHKSITDLTVFVITCGKNPNLSYCLEALKKQTIPFKLEIIKDIAPMAKAFQTMLDTCTTPYYIQVDEDMILKPNAIEIMYEMITESPSFNAMVCFYLHDVHLDMKIQGIKIYRHDIFKKYPYNSSVISCEMEQLGRMTKDKYTYQIEQEIVGEHSPYWTPELIFDRYFIFMQKNQLKSLPYKIFEIYHKSPTQLNWFALMGVIAGVLNTQRIADKDFTLSNPEYIKIRNTFQNLTFSEKKFEQTNTMKEHVIHKPNTTEQFCEFIYNQLQKEKIVFWVTEQSCLELVRYNTFLTLPLHIGVKTENDKLKLLELFKNYLSALTITVDVNQDTKPFKSKTVFWNVPRPVINYLSKKFGINWETFL